MRYTWPKFKLCRREQVNLFGTSKYDVKKRRNLPGQHGSAMKRNSEYGKLLRNKQVLKRSYQLTEKQFSSIVKDKASKYSKNKWISHDNAVLLLLESRLDSIIYRSGLAKTIVQARQMVNHWHFLLNGTKHNIPSTFVKVGDVISLKTKLLDSPLYSVGVDSSIKIPSWIKIDKNKYTVEVLSLPKMEEISTNADVLKVIEFYARA